jgi:hypothetical protein
MGLGKTLSALVLICWSLDFHDVGNDNEEAEADTPHATLVIAPKSSRRVSISNFLVLG